MLPGAALDASCSRPSLRDCTFLDATHANGAVQSEATRNGRRAPLDANLHTYRCTIYVRHGRETRVSHKTREELSLANSGVEVDLRGELHRPGLLTDVTTS